MKKQLCKNHFIYSFVVFDSVRIMYYQQGKIISVKTGKIKHKSSTPTVKSFIVNLILQDHLDMHPLNNKVNFGVVQRYRYELD